MDLSQSVGSSEALVQGVVWHGDSEKLSIDDDFELVGGRALGCIGTPAGAGAGAGAGSGPRQECDTMLQPSSITIKEPCFSHPVDPIQFRVLFLGSTGVERHKAMVLKKLSEVLASTLPQRKQQPIIINDFREKIHNIVFLDAFDSSPIEMYEDAGLHVIEANFLGPNNTSRLEKYLQTTRQKNERIDITVYLFSQHISRDQVDQDMRLLQQLDGYAVPIWPLIAFPNERPPSATGSRNLRSPSFMRPPAPSVSYTSTSSMSDLSQSLSDYLAKNKIETIDLADINPETPNFIQQENKQVSVALTVDQFVAIGCEELARILQNWRKTSSGTAKTAASGQWWMGFISASPVMMAVAALGMVFIVLATAALVIIRPSSSSGSVSPATPDPTTTEPIQMRLNPMWDAVDDETLRHLFVVELYNPQQEQHDTWAEQTLVVVLETDQLMEKEYNMVYEPGTRYNYVVDVPSPCLIHSQEDIVVDVVWRYEEDSRTKVEKRVDQVVLSLETCQPVYDRRGKSGECQAPTALTVVLRPYSHISWQLLFGKFKTESRKLTHTIITAWQALLQNLINNE